MWITVKKVHFIFYLTLDEQFWQILRFSGIFGTQLRSVSFNSSHDYQILTLQETGRDCLWCTFLINSNWAHGCFDQSRGVARIFSEVRTFFKTIPTLGLASHLPEILHFRLNTFDKKLFMLSLVYDGTLILINWNLLLRVKFLTQWSH